jgi:hypothetical protein
MKRSAVRTGALLPILVLALLAAPADGQEHPRGKGKADGAGKADPAIIAKLIEQLGSDTFKTRETASQQLAALDEVPDALRKAAKHANLEVARRAQLAIDAITARAEARAFEAMLRELHKVELDRFVRRMVTDEKFAGEPQWKIIETIAKAVTKEANRLGGRKFEVPDFAVNTLARLRFHGETKNPGSVAGSVLLSAGPTPRITSVRNAVVIVDGDFTGATSISNSLLIVRGNVGRVTGVTNSIILATGNWEGATGCNGSFVQVNNARIRFTSSRDSVLVNTQVKTTGDTNSRVLNTDKGPLQLLKFHPRPSDDQLVWGKEVNNLVVAITPAEQKDHFLIRWRNVGKVALQLSWARLHAHPVDPYLDDLLGHVFLKGPDGKLVPARQYPAPRAGNPTLLRRTVVLGPGQSHEETINLWAYVARPAADGRYQLSIELVIPDGSKGLDREVKTWTGKVQSNVHGVTMGK